MVVIKIDDIAAYTEGERIFCPSCVQSTSGLKLILKDQVSEDEEFVCDVCGSII
jgi:deoxyhypusine synthase